MFDFKLVFVSGVHGVGKGHLCSLISDKTRLPIFSASTLIKNQKNSAVDVDKRVIDPEINQSYLVDALKNINTESKIIVLDGHFCLYDGANIIEISFDFFKSIPIFSIIVLFDDPYVIYDRLIKRDGKIFDIDAIRILQNREMELGKTIAGKLNIPLLLSSSNKSSEIICWLEEKVSYAAI